MTEAATLTHTLPDLAQRLRPRLEAITAPAEDVAEVAAAGLTCWCDSLETGNPVDHDSLSPVLEAIRRCAARGIALDAMMRAYRIAARSAWQEILDLPVAQELIAPLSTRMLDFTDQLTTAAEQAYAAETLRGGRGADAVGNSALFQAVLNGESRALAYGTTWPPGQHCVVIVEAATSPEDPDPVATTNLDDITAALVRDARAAYWTTTGHGQVIAACPVEGAAGRDVLIRRLARFTNARHPLTVAIGGLGEGTSGTRNSYLEAIEALHVGSRLAHGAAGRIQDSLELTPLAILVSEPERARRFAHGALYPLGRLVDRSWVLPTLAAYLRCQGRLKEIAADLAVHPSTVKYRLNELRPFLDAHAGDGDQAAALLLAVRVCEYLAEPAEPPAPHPE
ncbi:MAG TPA: helix-turn-helix domain-containing protein [Actinospica sp.]|nr:helix-turn-helix domain-containing protein [Actinospica sp.]